MSIYAGSRYVEIENIKGNLAQGLILNDVAIKNLKMLPQGTTITIQRIHVSWSVPSLKGIYVRLDNGKFLLPSSDPILFYGEYKQGQQDLTVYSNHVAVHEIFDLFVENRGLKNISGDVSGLDIKIQGSLFLPELKGKLYVNKLTRLGFSLQECPVFFALTLRDLKKKVKVKGTVTLDRGKIASRQTSVDVHRSQIIFSKDPMKPRFACQGTSFIEGVKIDIMFKGTVQNPEIILSSEPSIADEIIIMMLATGKRWRSAERALYGGKVSPDIISDFVDFFLFNGTGSKLGRRIGVRDVSFTLEEEKRAVEIVQGVSSKAEIKYGIEQSNSESKDSPVTKQIVGVGYNITESESVSIQAERKSNPSQINEEKEEVKTDDKLMIKFKKRF